MNPKMNFQVNQSDVLPKCICATCWEKIENFHLFHQSVHCAQEEYLKQIFKCEVDIETENITCDITEQPNFVEVITNYDELEFADEYTTTKLDEDKEIKFMPDLTDVLSSVVPNEDAKSEFSGGSEDEDEEEPGKFILISIIKCHCN